MESGGHFSDGTRYGADEIVAYSSGKHGIFGQAFFDDEIAKRIRLMVLGKRVLDVGCGVGDWCYLAAQYGAKTVDGFDIQVGMVNLARQATLHLDNVHIQLGDAADMPYEDASFDVAMSLFVTCNLSPDAFDKHFQELYRVLAPGAKAILLIPTDWSHCGLYTKSEADPVIVEHNISKVLAKIPRHPTTSEVTDAFKEENDVFMCNFTVDTKGNIFLVSNTNQLDHGQPLWVKTEVIMFPNFFYSDHSITTYLLTAGFCIDSINNHFTEEKRIAHNNKHHGFVLNKTFVENPLALVYCVSKPVV